MKPLAVITLFIVCFWQLGIPRFLHADYMNQLQTELAGKSRELAQQQQQISVIKGEISAIQSQTSHLKVRLTRQQADVERAQEQLRKKLELVLTYPDMSTTTERGSYLAARQVYEQLESELAEVQLNLAHKQADMEAANRIAALIGSDMQTLQGKMAELNADRFRREIEQERTVTARGEISCGSLSIDACKRAALEQARRNAAEAGSAVMIESFTEVKDFQLERDEIRSRLHAIVLRHKVIDAGFIGHSGFYYEIEAVVKGQATGPLPPPPSLPLSPPSPPPPSEQTYALFIIPEPAHARIIFLNPTMPYTPGLPLSSGKYLVEARADGYVPQQEWIQISNADVTHVISLKLHRDSKKPKEVKAPIDAAIVNKVDEDRHFISLASGVVRDTQTGLEWYMGPDRDTSYRWAVSWARRLDADGGGWKLPSKDEIETIFERGKGARNMSRLFKTRGWFFWTSYSNWMPFDFSGGVQGWHELKPEEQSRAIAVRRP